MKLGKLPAVEGSVKLRLADYLNSAVLPKLPAEFGHESATRNWQMLANDQVGDCVLAGAAHETMLWEGANGRAVNFTNASVLSDYSAITGYTPADPNSDQGTDVQQAASYRRRVGVVDATGVRHKVGAYLSLRRGDLKQLLEAVYIFGTVGIGLQFPDTAMRQFDAGQPWALEHGAKIEGGHYVPVIGYRGGNLDVVTWGKVQQMTPTFYAHYCDEAIVYLSPEYLNGGKTPEGFDAATLAKDLAAITRL